MSNGQRHYSDYSGLYDDGYDEFKEKKMSKTEELLAVLDLTRQEQWEWLEAKFSETDDLHCCLGTPICFTGEQDLANLAFRLRDEMFSSAKGKAAWCRGCRIVIKAANNSDEFPVWSQPIHWIIAALIAKHKEKPDNAK